MSAVEFEDLDYALTHDVEQPLVSPRESEMIECGFRDVQEMLKDLNGFETWSQICLRALFG